PAPPARIRCRRIFHLWERQRGLPSSPHLWERREPRLCQARMQSRLPPLPQVGLLAPFGLHQPPPPPAPQSPRPRRRNPPPSPALPSPRRPPTTALPSSPCPIPA